MNIVVVGAGKVGSELCLALSREGHNIVLIEKDPIRLEDILDSCDITGFQGNGAYYSDQVKAGVDQCDMFISTSNSDEINIIACITAKKLGAQKTVCRIRTPEYSDQPAFIKGLGIDRVINPEHETAREINRVLQYPTALSVDPFAGGRVNLVELLIQKGSSLDGMPLVRFREHYPGLLACVLLDENGSRIPKGDTVITADQHLFVMGDSQDLHRLYKDLYIVSRIRSVLVVGGGRIAQYLFQMMRKTSKHVKVIERNAEKAEELATKYDYVEVICADGTDHEVLEAENLDQYDCMIATTGIDEENMILSMFAREEKVPRTITKVNRAALLPIAYNLGLQSIVTPAKLGATAIVRYVRSIDNTATGSDMIALHRIDGDIEIIQFLVKENFKARGKAFKDMQFRPGVLIALILRKGKLIFPVGSDHIDKGDQVLVVCKEFSPYDLNEVLRGEE